VEEVGGRAPARRSLNVGIVQDIGGGGVAGGAWVRGVGKKTKSGGVRTKLGEGGGGTHRG